MSLWTIFRIHLPRVAELNYQSAEGARMILDKYEARNPKLHLAD